MYKGYMQKTLYFWSIALLFLAGSAVASALVIFGVLPNTADDANMEYIELYNDSCESINLAGVILRDASGKTFTFSGGTLEPAAHRKVMRTESKIILNNTDESLQILDAYGNMIHEIKYTTSTRDIPIEWPVQIPDCQIVTTVEETTVETHSPEIDSTEEPTLLAVESLSTNSGNEYLTPSSSTLSGAILVPASSGALYEITNSGAPTAGSSETSSEDSNASTSSFDSVPASTLTGSISLWEWITVQIWDDIGSGTVLAPTASGTSSLFSTLSSQLSGSGGMVDYPLNPSYTGTTTNAWWVTLSDSTILIPLRLFLYDSNNNGKIDHLRVEYSGTLSWVLQREKFILYSASGGLADSRMETSSGVVRNLGYSGSMLEIDLIEQNIYNLALKISNTTESHLRLKTLAWFGLTSLFGVPVLPLTFTQSFDGYDGKFIYNTAISGVLTAVSNTSVPTNGPVTAPNNLTTSSSANTHFRILPDPKIIFQSGVTAQWNCKKASCQVNVIHVAQEKFEMCRWQMIPIFGVPQILDGCNPKAVSLGASGGTVTLTLLDSAGILPFKTLHYQIAPYSQTPKIPPWASMVSQESANLLQKPQKISPKNPSDITAKKTPVVPSAEKNISSKATSSKASIKPKNPSTKTTTVKKTTTSKASSPQNSPKAPSVKASTQSPSYQNQQTPSDPVALGIIGIACAGMGFCMSIFRRKESEPTG